jgi:hypothetical protein
MSAENERVVMRFFEEVCNGRKLDVAEQLFSADHVYHDPSSPWVGPGPDGMKQLTSVLFCTPKGNFPRVTSWQIPGPRTKGDCWSRLPPQD